MNAARAIVLAGLIATLPGAARADDPAESQDRRAALLHAIDSATPDPMPASPVTFRDLWNNQAAWQGRRVTVQGRIARRFAQPAIGPFPALTETWLFTEGENPLCLVYPVPEPASGDAPLGARVRFTGWSLGQVTYAGGDQPRLAPLIAGPEPPTRLDRPGGTERAEAEPALPWAWLAGGAALLGLLAALATIVASRRNRVRFETQRKPPPFPAEPGGDPSEAGNADAGPH